MTNQRNDHGSKIIVVDCALSQRHVITGAYVDAIVHGVAGVGG